MREMKDKPSRHLSLVEPFEFKLFVQSNDPDTFGDEDVTIPSVVSELTYNFESYHVDRNKQKTDWLFMSFYPEKIKRIVDTLRYNVKFDKAPGEHVTIACCISLGLARLNSSQSIRKLSDIYSQFKRRVKTGSLIEGFVGQHIDMVIACEVDGGNSFKCAVPPDVKSQITIISNETGLTMSSVGMMSIYATLVQQKETPENFIEEWQRKLDRSLELVECKLRGIEAILTMLPEEK